MPQECEGYRGLLSLSHRWQQILLVRRDHMKSVHVEGL